MKPVTLIATVFFGLIAALHLYRLLFQVPVTWAGADVPMWVSICGALFTSGLAFLLWRENRKAGG